MPKEKSSVIPVERIQNRIFYIRRQKVMFDRDLAELYGVETKMLNRAVKRNKERFPEDFMFQLNKQESELFLRFQFGTLKRGQHLKYLPYAFTEQGVAMLSSVLRSKRAVEVNIQIMRTFTHLRKMMTTHEELRKKIEQMEKKYDKKFQTIFQVIRLLLNKDEKPKSTIGFSDKK